MFWRPLNLVRSTVGFSYAAPLVNPGRRTPVFCGVARSGARRRDGFWSVHTDVIDCRGVLLHLLASHGSTVGCCL